MIDEPYKVSVCVPIYGVEKYIERCAKSLFKQSYENIEYIFVNDCTKDHSIELLLGVLEAYPERKSQVKIIQHKHNLGLGAARNTAIENCSGKFVMHVDSDDWLQSDCIKLCVEEQVKTNADIVSVDLMRISSTENKLVHFPDSLTPKEMTVALINSTIEHNIVGRLIRLSLYTENEIKVTEGVNMSEDLNVMPRLAYFSMKISAVPVALYYYYKENPNSYTASFSEKKFYQGQKTLHILDSFFKDKGTEYLVALEACLFQTLVISLIKSGRNNIHRDFYSNIRPQLRELPKSMYKTLSLPKRIALHIPWYPLFSIYVKVASYIKRTVVLRKNILQ